MTTSATSPSKNEKFVILRTYPSIDQEFCLWVALNAHKVRFEDLVSVHFKDDGLPEDGPDTTILDVDAVERYKGKHTSATLMQAHEYGQGPIKGFRALCEVLANNNGTGSNTQLGGYLKGIERKYVPFAHILRLVQHVNLKGLDAHESIVAWIGAFQKVCRTWFEYCSATLENMDDAPSIPFADMLRFAQAMPDLAERLAVDDFAQRWMSKPEGLLTLTGYIIARYTLMSEEDWARGGEERIRAEAEFWIDAVAAGEKLEKMAKEIAEQIYGQIDAAMAKGSSCGCTVETKFGPATFNQGSDGTKVFNTPVGRGALFLTEMREAIPPLWGLTKRSSLSLLVSRYLRPDGNVGILSRSGDLIDTSALAKRLREIEPDDCWADERRMSKGDAWSVLNGAKKIARNPTQLTDEELIALCQAPGNLKRRPQPQRNDHHRRGTHRGRR